MYHKDYCECIILSLVYRYDQKVVSSNPGDAGGLLGSLLNELLYRYV